MPCLLQASRASISYVMPFPSQAAKSSRILIMCRVCFFLPRSFQLSLSSTARYIRHTTRVTVAVGDRLVVVFNLQTVGVVRAQHVSCVVQGADVLLHLGAQVEDGGRQVNGVLRANHLHRHHDVLHHHAVRADLKTDGRITTSCNHTSFFVIRLYHSFSKC